ncbi:hypothetical protein ACH5RR_040019 [Cinchona calisaya]|uniref:Transmembrane 9 superfamily member n=1 Tax=Cinchona calisaya TaxID=153742 RepID=A0ABD2Y1M7_9GENT
MAVLTIFFSAMGFASPASRGALLIGMLLFYILLGIVVGYVAVWLLKTIKSGELSGWFSVSWSVAFFFPGIAFLILTILNFLLWGSHCTGAIPISTFLILLCFVSAYHFPLLSRVDHRHKISKTRISSLNQSNCLRNPTPKIPFLAASFRSRNTSIWNSIHRALLYLGKHLDRPHLLCFWVSAHCIFPVSCGMCRSFSGPDIHESLCGGLEMVVEVLLCIKFGCGLHLLILH